MHINREQEKIAYTKPNGHMLIKGIAGSGKTTIGIYRIAFLLNNYCHDREDEILFLTFNKTLVNYVNHVYNKIDITKQYSLFSFGDSSKEKVKITTVDSLMYRKFKDYCKKNGLDYSTNITNYERYSTLRELTYKLDDSLKKEEIFLEGNVTSLLEEINWIKACNYQTEEEYQKADRIGSIKKGTLIQKLPKNSVVRKTIFSLMIDYTVELKKKKLIDYNDMRILALNEIKENPGKKFKHIIIDESQDLSRVQLEFLKLMYLEKERSSISFLYDSAQSIYSHSWLGNGDRSFSSIGFNMVGKSKTLSKNFRTTTQISRAAYSMLGKNELVLANSEYIKPFLIDRNGPYPIFRRFTSLKSEAKGIIEILEKELYSYNKKDIAIVARTKNQLNDLREIFKELGIDSVIVDRETSDFDSDYLRMFTMHSIKGIECKIVIAVELNSGVVPLITNEKILTCFEEAQERKLFYVGMTRATEVLYLLSSKEPSKFIGDIDSKYLSFNIFSKFKQFYNVLTDDYLFKNKIKNLNSPEEKVRQWFLKELVESYNFNLESLELEREITLGSRKYFVDISINLNKKPTIFVETKGRGASLKDGLKQLKSYMKISESVMYGIITNGQEIKIIDRGGVEVKDIPNFDSEAFEEVEKNDYTLYKSFASKFSLCYKLNSEKLFIKEGEQVEEIDEEVVRVPFFNDMVLSQKDYEADDYYIVPNSLGKKSDFIVKNKSNSMEPLFKENEDILVSRDGVPNNGDIVLVAIDEKAIFKRYMKIGNSILLTSDNNDYEPIYFNEEDIRENFLGICTGSLSVI